MYPSLQMNRARMFTVKFPSNLVPLRRFRIAILRGYVFADVYYKKTFPYITRTHNNYFSQFFYTLGNVIIVFSPMTR